MADRAINFTEPMVAGIEREIERPGTGKTETRRGLNISGHRSFTEFGVSDTPGYDWHFRDSEKRWHDLRDHELKVRLPWQVGDKLWVRESYYQYGHWEPIVGEKTKTGLQKWGFVPDEFRDPVQAAPCLPRRPEQQRPTHPMLAQAARPVHAPYGEPPHPDGYQCARGAPASYQPAGCHGRGHLSR